MASDNLLPFRATKPQKATRTTVDTIVFTPEVAKAWRNPPFQRPLKTNSKVVALGMKIAEDSGVVPGIITLGMLADRTYLLDGQHRREAFLLSGCKEGFADVRTHYFDNMAEMGEEFVLLNSQLVRLMPDDILRGLEASYEPLRYIRKQCPFVGYGNVRRDEGKTLLSMSTALRVWAGSAAETPGHAAGMKSATALAQGLTQDEAEPMVRFLNLCRDAWGVDKEYYRMWGSLNLVLCAWLYRNMVLRKFSQRAPQITGEQFKQCLMALTADPNYIAWLLGRQLRESDRSPAFERIRSIFANRLAVLLGSKPAMPRPAWAHAG